MNRWSELFDTWLGSPADVVWSLAFWLVFGLLVCLEDFLHIKTGEPHRMRRWPVNFSFGIVNVLLASLVPVSVLLSAEWARANGLGALNQVSIPAWGAAGLSLVAVSFTSYAVHVLMHRIGPLWRLHRVHHMDNYMDISSGFRAHPMELIVSIAIKSVVAIGLGVTPLIVVGYEIAETVFNLLTHTSIRLSPSIDRSVRWVFATPNMHSLHHSSLQIQTDSNYGGVFTLWDRLFGTYTPMPQSGHDQTGLAEVQDERAWSLWWQTRSPLISIARSDAESAAQFGSGAVPATTGEQPTNVTAAQRLGR